MSEHNDRNEDEPRRKAVADPSRRRLLAIGGITVASGVALAACGNGSQPVVQHTGTQPVTSSTAVPPQAPPVSESATDQQNDVALLQTATSLELLLVNFYEQVVSMSYVQAAPALTAIKLFRDHHTAHANALQAATTAAGGKPYDQPNKVLQGTLIDSRVKVLTDPTHGTVEADWLKFCRELEDTATATYAVGGSTFTTATLRQTAMGIGGIEARHETVLNNLITPSDPSTWVPVPLQLTTDAVGSDAMIGAKSS